MSAVKKIFEETGFLIDMALTVLLSLIQKKIPKDASSKKAWKLALLKLFKAIAASYKDDPDFNPQTEGELAFADGIDLNPQTEEK